MSEYTHVANSRQAWGKGDTENEAFTNMLSHVNPDRIPGTTFEFSIATASGDATVNRLPTRSWVEADDVVDVTDYEMSLETLRTIRERQTEFTILVEESLVAARREAPSDEEVMSA